MTRYARCSSVEMRRFGGEKWCGREKAKADARDGDELLKPRAGGSVIWRAIVALVPTRAGAAEHELQERLSEGLLANFKGAGNTQLESQAFWGGKEHLGDNNARAGFM